PAGALFGGRILAPAELKQLGQQVFAILVAAFAEALDRREVDRQIVLREAQHARGLARDVLHDRAVGQPEDDRVAVLAVGEEAPLARRDRRRLSLAVGYPGTDPEQALAVVLAAFDPERDAVLDLRELADLDRRAERARAQLEVELLVGVAGQRLPVADDREVD